MSETRTPEHPVNALFYKRWSPRAYSGENIDEASLLTLLEAARWAPSAYNAQPWRFIYARKGTDSWPRFLEFLSEYNHSWAQNASALIILLSKTNFVPPGKTEPQSLASHSFDAGAAWANLALQAEISGWPAHAIGGFDRDKARTVLGVPAEYVLETAIAIGKQAERASLPEALQAREIPNTRQPLASLIAESRFAFAD
jgi:nitroreductase